MTDHLGERIFIAIIAAKTKIKIQTKVVKKAKLNSMKIGFAFIPTQLNTNDFFNTKGATLQQLVKESAAAVIRNKYERSIKVFGQM